MDRYASKQIIFELHVNYVLHFTDVQKDLYFLVHLNKGLLWTVMHKQIMFETEFRYKQHVTHRFPDQCINAILIDLQLGLAFLFALFSLSKVM
jgi:hypothetical protein